MNIKVSPRISCTEIFCILIILFLTSHFIHAQSVTGADFSGDGAADLGFVHNDGGQVTLKVARSNDSDSDFIADQHILEDWIVQSGTYSPEQRFFYADFNGDGAMDVAKLWNDSGLMSCEIYKAADADTDFIYDSFVLETWATQSGDFAYTDKWFVADFNGDFMADIARAYKDGTARSIYVYTSTGTSFNAPVRWANQQGAYSADRIWLSGDFNGDFNNDFAVVSNNGGQVHIEVHSSNGTNSFGFGTWASGQGNKLSSMKFVAADFNADGMTDVARVWNDNGQVSIVVHRSTGSSFVQESWLTQSGTFAREDKWLVGDFNADLMSDIVRIKNDSGMVTVESFQSNGTAFTPLAIATQITPYRDQNRYVTGDFDGDFILDIGVTWANASNWNFDIISGAGLLSNHTNSAVGSYYSDYNLVHKVWGDNFVNHNAVTGAIPVPPTGQESMLQDVLDSGNDLFLIKNAVYNVNDPLTYKSAYQRIETHDALFIADYAILRQQIDLGERDRLIRHGGQDYIHLENVICDGNKYNLGQKAWVQGQGAMVALGAADGHWVRRVVFYNSRTWSTCQIHEGDGTAHGSIVEHNFVLAAGNGPRGNGRDLGEKGNQSEGGTGNTGWSDGFSVGARETIIRHNFIMDCTDVGVVLFGVPDGNCHDNYIFNFSRESLGGINLVDGINAWNLGPNASDPLNTTDDIFDYSGLKVENNIIGAEGARIQLGLPISNQAWVPENPEIFDFGGTGSISGNRLWGGAMGYGYILSHIRNLNFANNISDATHSGKGNGSGANGGDPDAATAFLRDNGTIAGSTITENDPDDNFVNNTKAISHLLYMNHAPNNADGYKYYAYTDPEAEAIVTASYLEMLGRAPTAVELNDGKNQFLTNDLMIGDDLKRNLMGYAEFSNKYGAIGSESLHVFRTARWRDRVIALDGKSLIDTGNFSQGEQLHDEILADLLYTDLSATHASNITLIQPSLPTNMNQGDIINVGVVVQNTGSVNWENTPGNPERIAFASVGDDTTFGTTRYYIPEGVVIAPGQSHTFNLQIVAPPILYDPNNLGPTPFPIDFKMLLETVGWFGESIGDELGGTHQIAVQHSDPPPPPPFNDSNFTSLVLTGDPETNGIQPGATFIAQVTFENTGNTTWSSAALYSLGTLNDDMTWGTNRGFFDSVSVIAPGESFTFDVVLTAPVTPGTYGMQWRLLNSDTGWFGAISTNVNIDVNAGAPPLAFNYASFVSTDMPSGVLPGQQFDVSVTMRNDGTTDWTYIGPGNGYALGTNSVEIDRTDAPNAIYSSEFNDSPVNQEANALFDNDSTTRFATFNNNAWIQHQFGGGVQHSIKKYSITSAPSGSPLSNIIQNGSFESGTTAPDNWNISSGSVSWTTEQSIAGSYSLKYVGDGATFITPTQQDVLVTQNTDYEVSVWVLTENMTSGPLVFDLNDKPTPATEVQYVIQAGQATTWTEYKSNWNSGTETSLRIRIFAETAFNGTAYIDNISVVDLSLGGGEEFDPASWTFEGSNDGNNWTVVDTRSGIDFPNREERIEFDCSSNSVAYEYYRLDMTNNSGSILQLSEVELFTAAENSWSTADRIPVTGTVIPGQTHTFTVSATAPTVLGDYPFKWQMVQDPVGWFGAFTPSAQISVTDVVEGNAATFVGYNQSTTGTMTTEVRPGVQFGVELTFLNSGTTTWGAGYATGNTDELNNPWTVQQVSLPDNVTVAPGETYSQFITVTAPDINSDPTFVDGKTYDFQRRMLHQGVEWFGLSSTATTITVYAAAPDAPAPATSAAFVSYANIPNESGGNGSIKPGAGFNIDVTYENNGITPWNSGFRIGEQPVDLDEWNTGRLQVPPGVTVNPGEQYTFRLSATAPLVEQVYTFSRRMIQPAGAGWFGEISPAINITVSSTAPDVAFDDATFTSWNAPNGAITGQSFTVNVTMENTGTTTWSDAAGYALATKNPVDNTLWTGSNRVTLGAAVIAPGQSHTFAIAVTAPLAQDNYDFQWGMVQDGGVGAFGDLTPNQIITVGDVIQGNAAQFVSHDAPAVVPPGANFLISFTFRNIGSNTWDNDPLNGNANAYKTGSTGPNPLPGAQGGDLDNLYWGVNRVSIPNGVSVATGQEYTFVATVTAPSSATDPAILPGGQAYVSGTSYPFHRRMIHEGLQWFGDVGAIDIIVQDGATAPPPAPVNGASVVSVTGVPATIRAGIEFDVTVTMQNDGNTDWTEAGGYTLGEQDPQDGTTWTLVRAKVPTGVTVAPGQQYAFLFTARAPAVAGTYPFQRRMVQEGVEWFGDLTVEQTVTVTANVNSPIWVGSPIVKVNATENALYSISLAGDVSDADGDPIDFGKANELYPWIDVAEDGTLSGTPTAAEVGQTFNVDVEATDGSNVAVATIQITVDAAPSDPAIAWVDLFDNTLPASQKLGDADPDGDGYDNNYEYFFGMNPVDSGNSRLPTAVNGGSAPSISYTRQIAASYTVQTSTDLGTWSTAGVTITNGPTANGDGTETLTVTSDIDFSTESKQFFRIVGN